MEKKLFELLNIHKGITAIIGGGGKTTLMLTLAKELAEFSTVIITTSTKILKPEDCETLLNTSKEEIQTSLEKSKMLCPCFGYHKSFAFRFLQIRGIHMRHPEFPAVSQHSEFSDSAADWHKFLHLPDNELLH